MPHSALPARRVISSRRPTASKSSWNGRFFPTAGMRAAIPVRSLKSLDLLPLRQAFASRNIAPPQALQNAIDRMMPMLRFFRHSEGTFAHFNGMGATPADLLLTLLAYDEARGAPFSNAPYSGYQRLA